MLQMKSHYPRFNCTHLFMTIFRSTTVTTYLLVDSY